MDGSGEDRKYAIVVEGYDEPVGFTALYGLFRQTAPELGALIGDDVRGKGVGRRAEALTIAKAFDEFGAHRVYGRIPARNEIAKKTVSGPRLEARGDDARPPARAPTASTTARSGACCPTSSAPPPPTCCRERPDRAGRRVARRPRRGGGERGVLPLAPLPRRRGRHPHAADRGRRQPSSLAPLIVREIPGTDERDAISPYGYPGLAERGAALTPPWSGQSRDSALDPAAVDFSATGLVSIFIRHTLARAAAGRRRRAQRRPDRRPGAAAEEPLQRPQPDQQEPPRRL